MADGTVTIKAVLDGEKATSGVERIKSRLLGLSKTGSKVGSIFKSVLGANIVGAGISKGISAIKQNLGGAIDRFDTLKKYPVVMNALGYSADDVAKSTKILSDGIDGLPTTLSDITKSAQNFAPLTGNAETAAKAAVSLNNAFLASGASVSDTSRGMQQYSQMLATGKVDMMSWRTLMETMPVALNKVADSFGFTGKSAKQDLFNALKNGEITMDELNNKFIELNNGQNGFAQLAKKNSAGIGTSFSNLGNAVVKNMANMINAINAGFGKAGLGSIASVLDSFKGTINSTFEAITPVVSKVTTVLINGLKRMWESFKDTGAVSALKTAFDDVKAAFDNVKTSLSGNGDIFKSLGDKIGDIVTWLSQATSGIADFIANMKPGTIEAVAKAITAVVLAFKGLSILANLNPFTIMISAIAGLVLAFAQAYNSSEAFRNGVKKALDILKEWGPAVAAVVGGFTIFKMLNGWNPFKAFAGKGKSAFESLKNAMTGGSNSAKRSQGIITQVFTGLGNIIKSAGTGIATAAKGIGTGIKTALSGIPGILRALGTAVATVAEGIGTGLATAFKGLGMAIAMVPPPTWLALGAAILMIGAAFALAGTQASGISQIFQTVGNVIVQILQQVTASLATLIPIVASAMAMLIPIVAGAISTIVGAVASGISQIILAFATGFSMIVSAVAGAIATVVGAFSGLISAIAGLVSAIGGVLQGIASIFNSVFAGVTSVITAFGTQVSSILTSIGSTFKSFGESVKSVFEGVSTVIESFGTSIKSILDGVSGVITSLGTAALNAGKGGKQMAQGVKMLVDLPLGDLGATLAKTASGLSKIGASSAGLATAGTGMTQLGTGMQKIGTASNMAVTGLSIFVTRLTNLQTSITTLPSTLMQASTAFTMFSTQALTAMTGLTTIIAPITMFKTQVMTLAPALMMTGTGFTMFGTMAMMAGTRLMSVGMATTMLSSQLSVVSASLSMAGSGFNTINSAASSLSGVFARVGASASALQAQMLGLGAGVASAIMSAVAAVTAGGAQMSSAIRSAGQQMISSMQSCMNQITSAVRNGINNSTSAVRTGGSQMTSVWKSSGSQMVSITQSFMNQMTSAVRNGMNNIVSAVRTGGSQMVSAMRSAGTQLVSAVQSAVNQAASAARSGYGAFQSAGAYIGQGLAVGMRSALGAVTAAANELVAQANRAAQAKAKINSPSHLFRDEVGWWIGLGIAKGIDNSAPEVANSLDYIRAQVAGFNVKANNLLSGATANLSSQLKVETLRGKTPKVQRDARQEAYIAHSASLLSDVIDSLENLRDQVAQGQNMVLDTGALVGGTAGAYDNAIGTLQTLKGRHRL
ncbi:tape measure protein [Streptococcus pneumoniae]|nr:tape measure protein [Streptococcus pneumoniae]